MARVLKWKEKIAIAVVTAFISVAGVRRLTDACWMVWGQSKYCVR
ncbi:MAG: hypothetical protein ACRD11_05560 [Terriglobia bacterium]